MPSVALKTMMILFLALPFYQTTQAQCNWSGPGTTYWFNNPNALDCGNAAHTENVGSGTASFVYLSNGNTYCFSTCGSPFDTEITIYDGNPAWTARAYNNDNGPECPGNNASLTYKATYTGTHRVVINRYNCQQYDGTGLSAVLSIRECGTADPQITGGGSFCQNSYTFTRSTPPQGVFYYWQTSPTGTATNNLATSYTVSGPGEFTVYLRARSQGGCWIGIDSATVTLNNLRIDSLTSPLYPNGFNIDTFGTASGSINLTITGSAAPFTYTWSTGDVTEDISGLTVGTYYVTVTDTAGCTRNDSITLTGPSPCSLPFVLPSGTIQDGGVLCELYYAFSHSYPIAGVDYYWQTTPNGTGTSNSDSTYTVTGAGTQTVYLRAQNSFGCWSNADTGTVTLDSMFIRAITSPLFSNGFHIDVAGNATGVINLNATGYSLPLTYQWSNGDTIEDLTGLTAGTYTVTVTTANGCADTASFTLTEPGQVIIGIEDVEQDAQLQVYPNPFSTFVNFMVEVPTTTQAKLVVYSLSGAVVNVVFDGELTSGKLHQLRMDIPELATGIYYYRFTTESGINRSGKLVRMER